MTEFEMLMLRHLDTCIEAGELKRDTGCAVRALIRKFTCLNAENKDLQERLKKACDALRSQVGAYDRPLFKDLLDELEKPLEEK